MTQASERPRRKRLSWESRCEVVAAIEQGVSPPLAAASGGCSRATAYRLWRRYREGSWAALQDRPCTPHRQPRRLSAEAEARIVATRRRTAYGPVRLSGLVPHPPSTIGKVLRRHGCSRLPRPGAAAARCARRYERERPGELLHVDTDEMSWTVDGRLVRWARIRPGQSPRSDPERKELAATIESITNVASLERLRRKFSRELFARNGLVYELDRDGHVRLGSPVRTNKFIQPGLIRRLFRCACSVGVGAGER